MGSYEIAPEQALESAIRIIKEGRVQGIKLEGGREMAATVGRITKAGIPVIGHIGLTPQRQHALGGFRVQGKTSRGALKVLEDALALQAAGCFALVLEAIPAEVASLVTDRLSIPTIGIGAGNGCAGQVLVQVDMSGNFPPGRFLPKFVKQYGDVWGESLKAIEAYKSSNPSIATFPHADSTTSRGKKPILPCPGTHISHFTRGTIRIQAVHRVRGHGISKGKNLRVFLSGSNVECT
jgi:3-methyl-2-oxobutanoate hydroxymethyltransferase